VSTLWGQVQFAGGRVTWKKSKDRTAPDVDRLASEHPALVAQYIKPAEGSRRFLVQPHKAKAEG